MVQISTPLTALLVAFAPTAAAFVPSRTSPSFINRQTIDTTTSLDAAPTMVVF